MEETAHLSIVLHAHLPFVRHPEHDYHLEELWFFEAMHETYLPLLMALDRLEEDGVGGALTLSLSAPLLAMMDDRLLGERFVAHLDRLVEFCRRDAEDRADGDELGPVAAYYHRRLRGLRAYYVDDLDGDVIGGFGDHADGDRLELMTCVGTHPILPFMATEAGRRAQIRVGLEEFERCFGDRPSGIWIAECAFEPGVDDLLAAEGIEFACLEERAITCADSAPVYGTYAPLVSPGGVAFFGRDQFAGSQVWSADEGYPGDPVYREFYRDRGYDLRREEVASIIHPDGIRHDTGLKYHRITGDVDLDDKAPYRPDEARRRAREHGRHFVDSRIDQLDAVTESLGGRLPQICCPYDAELFGHWWFEGPEFLEAVFRRADETDELTLSTPPAYLEAVDVQQQTTPATSTWGKGGYFEVWLDESNAWIYRHLRNAEHRMVELVDDHRQPATLGRRALCQAGRELMLAQSSDWPFIIHGETTVEYAHQRLATHLEAFERLAAMIDGGEIDEEYLVELEGRHNLFPQIQPDHWRSQR